MTEGDSNMSGIRIRLLEVDLTTGQNRVLDVTGDARRYLGGNGLASRFIWDLVPQGTDPLGPDNILHVGVGPITGLVGCKVSCSFISPLTGWAGEASVSGYIGDELMRARYNAGILIRGRAREPVYLFVYNDRVEVRDASDLWGQYLVKTENTLRERLYRETGQEFGTLCIGPAGENLVRYANAVTENVHSASKGGVGAVFGSKNLKAVAVKGTRTLPYADHNKVWELKKKYAMHPITALYKNQEWGRYGASDGMRALLNYAGDPIKNAHSSWDPIADKSDHILHELSYRVWTDGCPGCATPCFMPFFKNTPHGAFSGEIRHGNTSGLCGNAMMGYDEVEEINTLIEELGIDAEDVQGHIAWAMDLYEHGIITKEDLGGIDLKWGERDAAMELVKKIAYKEGHAPAALAEGYRHAIDIFGAESAWYAWHSPANTSIPRYDVRNKVHGMALPYGTSHYGGMSLYDSATICLFSAFPFYAIWGPPHEVARTFLNAACGWDLTPDEIADITRRNDYFSRCISLRAGFRPEKDAGLPQRAFDEPVTDKYGKTWVWAKEEWEAEKKAYYINVMKLSERGLPLGAELQRLGLEFVIPVLEPMDAID
jgi:aldehyde:ferredoxin oxidoreductase